MSTRRYVIVTPFNQPEAVAGILKLHGFNVAVIPTASGAVVVHDLPERVVDDWDIAELVGEFSASDQLGSDKTSASSDLDDKPTNPADDVDAVSATISRLSQYGVVVLTVELGDDLGFEPGVSGMVSAYRVLNGERGEELAAGQVINSLDDVVEDLVLGRDPKEIATTVDSRELNLATLERLFGRRKKKKDADSKGEGKDTADASEQGSHSKTQGTNEDDGGES